MIVNAGYTNGMVGEAFEIDPENWPVGTFNGVLIPDSPAYILTNAFTIECWIRPRGDSYEIFTRGDNRPGLDPYSFSMEDDNIFKFAITDNSGNSCTLTLPLVYNVWWHMAGTYSNGVMILYTNGAVVAQTTTAVVPIGALIPGDHPGLGIGNNNDGYNNFPFTGDIDEVSLYNRALSPSEIQAIYNSGSAGKCFNPTPPTITSQPTNETVYVGQAATFSVAASGTPPLSYQWTFDTTNIVGATNATLMLPDIQPTNAGNYAVIVSNSVESVLSSNAVLTVSMPSCDPAPSGLVGWWKGDGNVYDSAGTNNGVIVNAGYTNGMVGEAFEIDPENWPVGTFNGVLIPDSPAYILTNAFTIECWIRPRGDSYEIFTRGDNRPGLDPYSFSMEDDNIFKFAITDNSGNSCTLTLPLVYNVWWHMAGTYSNGVMILYTNGAVVAQTTTAVVPIGALIPGDHPGLGIGNNNDGYNNFPFTGDIDEVSLYNRALSPSEIQAIYNSGSAGKCFNPTPPTITSQPTNETVYVGQIATFSVSASGTQLLSYQWTFDTTNIVGATNATFTLPDVQFTNAGNYAVVVSNLVESVLSSNAVLTVNPPPPCDTPPSGLVGWWRGEGNAWDSSGYDNNGTVVNAGYTNGVVGEAFSFDPENWPNGTFNGIEIPDSPAYVLTNAFTIEGWIRPRGDGNFIFIRGDNRGGYDPYALRMQGNTTLAFQIIDNANNSAEADTTLSYNTWWYVAATFNNGVMDLYTNGVLAAQTVTTLVPIGNLIPGDHPGVGIGNINDGAANIPFIGDIDEMSLYNRALSQAEIQAIYSAYHNGKCFTPTPPVITSQPTNQMVFVGQTATFNVSATSTTPLVYQWQFDGTNIVDATNATLTLSDVQLIEAGYYDVAVTNMAIGLVSSNAFLVVSPLDHFSWAAIPSPRFLNAPFPVTIVAQDATNGTVLTFNDSVMLDSTNDIPISPVTSGNFVQGVWTGTVHITKKGTNIVLRADDGLGHTGLSVPFNVLALPSVDLQKSGNILLFNWPANYSSFVLEESSNLFPSAWSDVPVSPLQIGNQYIVPLEMSGTNGFYRLRFLGP